MPPTGGSCVAEGRNAPPSTACRPLADKAAALGARPFVERCDAELTACGVEPTAQQPSGPALTPQEQIVATLVCQGLSNREVARHLVLSVKTVGYHLSNVYAKLDVHSRTQLVAVLGRPT